MENNKCSTLTKNGILQHLKSETGFADNEAKNLLTSFFSILEEETKQGNNVKFYEFGTFSKKVTKEKKARNFTTKEIISIPPKAKITFTKSKVKKTSKLFLL